METPQCLWATCTWSSWSEEKVLPNDQRESHTSFCTYCLLSCHHHWKWLSTLPFAPYFLVLIGISPHWRETKEAFQGVLGKKKIKQLIKATFFCIYILWPKYVCSKLTAGRFYHGSVCHFCGQSWHITATT